MGTDPAADFRRCHDTLDGAPAPPPAPRAADKLLYFVTRTGGDLSLTAAGISWITPAGRRHRYVSELGPATLHTLLRAGALPSPLRASAAALIPPDHTPPFTRAASAVWFCRRPEEIRLVFRAPPGPLGTPLVPIPTSGPWALPALAVVGTPARDRAYQDNEAGRPCPHCGAVPARFRDIGDRWVCGACGRSFLAPG